MKRLVFALACLLFASPLMAGAFEKDVKELLDENTRVAALDRLSEAGVDAYDDVFAGLKVDLGTDAAESAKRRQQRMVCAQLLGTFRDSRASAEMLRLIRDEKTRQDDPSLVATLVQSLGLIWSAKADSAERKDVVAEVKLRLQAADSGDKLRYGCLLALANLKTGAAEATAFLADDKPEMLRSAAIGVLTATQEKGSSAKLLEVWTKQRAGENKDYNRAIGLTALFAVASFKDAASLDGLVEVLTMREFDREEAARSRARLYLKDFSADATNKLAAIIEDDNKADRHARAAELLGGLGGKGVTAMLQVAKKDKEGETKFADRVYNLLRSLRGDEANDAMVEAFRILDKKDPARVKLLDQLLLTRPKKGGATFKEAAEDKDLVATARARAVEAYADGEGKTAFDVLKAWSTDENVEVRRAAVRCLGRSYIPQTKSEDALKAALKDKDPEVRSTALKGLWLFKKKELLDDFLNMMKPDVEPDASVRRAAVEGVENLNRNAGLNDQGLVEPLKAAMKDPDATVRAAALGAVVAVAVRRAENNVAKEMMELALTDKDPLVRSKAYTQVHMVAADIDAKKVVEAALKETDAQQKGDAVQGLQLLGQLPDGDLGPISDLAVDVLQQTNSPAARHAQSLIKKLTDQGVPPIAPKVRALLDTAAKAQPKDYRRWAIYIATLAELKDKDSFKLIQTLAREPNFESRQAAVKYIEAVGDRSDIDFLRELRDLGDATAPTVRQDIENAIHTLEAK